MTALSFTGPIFVTMGATLFLGEMVRIRRIMAIAVGFVGALIILRPGLVDVSLGAMLALVSALSIRSRHLIVKKMTETEQASAIVFWMVMLQAPIAFVPMLFLGMADGRSLALSLGHGAVGNGGTCSLHSRRRPCRDHQPAAAGIRQAAFGRLAWLVFSEWPDIWIWIGGSVIFARPPISPGASDGAPACHPRGQGRGRNASLAFTAQWIGTSGSNTVRSPSVCPVIRHRLRRGGAHQRHRAGIDRNAVERCPMPRNETFQPVERASFSKTCARQASVLGAVTPAQPQVASLAESRCGALSVPRKKDGSPEVAAATRARRCVSRLATGRQ